MTQTTRQILSIKRSPVQQQTTPERDKTISVHKVKSDSSKTPQKPAGQQRIRPQGMTKAQWKQFKQIGLLAEFWPVLFDPDNPKPLKIGIHDDMEQDVIRRGLTLEAGKLKTALACYARRMKYQKALAAGGARYDLNGEPYGEITPEQQQEAADDINRAKGN